MTDLTKFFGEEGLAIDPNFAFANKGKSIQDLMNEMQTHGLLVDYIDTVSYTHLTLPTKA